MLYQDIARQQQSIAFGFVQFCQGFERVALGNGKASGFSTAQGGQVGKCADVFGDVFAEGANVSALAATYVYHGFRCIKFSDINGVNGDVARFAFDNDTFACVFVQWFAFVFEGGKHRRHLADIAC